MKQQTQDKEIREKVKEILTHHEARFGTCGNSATSKEVKRNCVKLLANLVTKHEEEFVERLEKMKKQDADLSPGFNVTAEFKLGELRGFNQAIKEILEIIKPNKQ